MPQCAVVSKTVSSHYSGRNRITLVRSLGIGALLAIAVSSISQTTSVFINFGPVLHGVGTGIVLAFLIGGVSAILNSLIYAELSNAIPVSGGAYAIALRVFGRPIGLVTAFLCLLIGLGSAPSLILGIAGYLQSFFPGVNEQVYTVAVALLATMMALMRIHSASWLTAAMVIIEFLIILGITLISFFHFVHPMSFVLHRYAITSSGIGHSLGSTILFSMIGVTLFSFSGYEMSQNFAEKTMNVRRVLVKTILVSAIIAVVVETAAVLGLLLAAENIGSVYSAEVSSTAFVQSIHMRDDCLRWCTRRDF
ncbi:APC family permease [Alicyclobacillus pomorum]|uniref:APC family permease n=1 Tax=Alicyclobacillus pomorum TaxID=204470 RepID=UPI000479D57E|nr:APC family permease [Alicyclobacillus pomorum]